MKYFLLIILVASVCVMALGFQQPEDAEKQQARELLERARARLGVAGIQSLSGEARIRRVVKYVEVSSPTRIKEKEKKLTSKLQIDFVLPDKFRIREKGSRVNGVDYETLAIMNGHEAWLHPLAVVPSTPESKAVVSVKDAGQNFLRNVQTARALLSRFSLGLLATGSAKWPFEPSFAGSFSTDEADYDVISLLDLDGYKSLLLLEPSSHLPVILNETVILSTPITVIPTGFGFDRRYNRALMTRAREERVARNRPPHPISVQIRLSDRRHVGGLLLPFRMTTYHNGQLYEEIEFTEFTVNGQIDPRKFLEKRPN